MDDRDDSNDANLDDDGREARFIAEFSQIYLEVIAGLRTPEQLSRWLGDDNFLALHDARLRQKRAREFLRLTNVVPQIRIMKVAFFPSQKGTRSSVVLFKWSGMTRALTLVTKPLGHRRRFHAIDIVGA